MKFMRDLPRFFLPMIFTLGIAYAIGLANIAHSEGFKNCADAFVGGVEPKYQIMKNNNIINLCKTSTTKQGMDVVVPACFYRVMIGKKDAVYSVVILMVSNDDGIDSIEPIENFSVSYNYLSGITKINFLGGFNEMDWTKVSIDSGKWDLPPDAERDELFQQCK